MFGQDIRETQRSLVGICSEEVGAQTHWTNRNIARKWHVIQQLWKFGMIKNRLCVG